MPSFLRHQHLIFFTLCHCEWWSIALVLFDYTWHCFFIMQRLLHYCWSIFFMRLGWCCWCFITLFVVLFHRTFIVGYDCCYIITSIFSFLCAIRLGCYYLCFIKLQLFLLHWIIATDVVMALITPWHWYWRFIDTIFNTSLFCYYWFIVVIMFELHCDLHSFYLHYSCLCIEIAPISLIILCHGYWWWPHCWYVSLFLLLFLGCVICVTFFFFVLFASFLIFLFGFSIHLIFVFLFFYNIWWSSYKFFFSIYISGGTNFVRSTDGSNIFVDCSRSDELFISSFPTSEFSEFPPPECNPNLFEQLF
jgi:hypothetical protein